VFRDEGYRTSVGTAFYDRVVDVNFLSGVVLSGGALIVFGPRNVGKSELLRYVSSRLPVFGWASYYIDLRELQGGGALRAYFRESSLADVARSAARAIGYGGVLELLEALLGYAERAGALGVCYVIDEVQFAERSRALLEALAKRVVYRGGGVKQSVVVASSEGYLIYGDELWRARGYGYRVWLVEEMDYEHFSALASELEQALGLKLGVSVKELYENYTGGNPGELVAVARLGFEEWLRLRELELLRTIARLSLDLGVPRGDLLRLVAETPLKVSLGDRSIARLVGELARHNIVYYNPDEFEEPLVKPQVRVYKYLASKLLVQGTT